MLKGGRKRALPSVSDFADLVNQTLKKNARIPVYYGQFFASTATSVSNIMKTSKGRDKICSFIQYWADFYYSCIKNSNIEEINDQFKNNQIYSARLSLRVKQSMSQGRKIFKFLKFLDEVKNIEHFLRTTKKPLLLKILITLSHVSSFFYYILDNTLWAIAMGILSEFFEEDEYTRWKKKKHSFSLMRNILQLVINLLRVSMSKKKEKAYVSELESMKNKIIQRDDDSYNIIRLLIRKRRKRRFEILEVLHSILRLIMLTKSLELPGSEILHPIFVSFCGLISSHISLFKALQEKQKLIKIEANPEKPPTTGLKTSTSYYNRSLSSSKLEDIIE